MNLTNAGGDRSGETGQPNLVYTVAIWEASLQQPVSHVLPLLTGTSERAVRLRQSNPFAGVLSPRERTAILKEHAADDEASA